MFEYLAKKLSKKSLKQFQIFLGLCSGVIIASALLDLYLWLMIKYLVPSYAIAGMSFGFALIVIAEIMSLQQEYNSRGSLSNEN